MEDLLDFLIYKLESRDDWIELGKKEEKKIGVENISSLNLDINVGDIDIKNHKKDYIGLTIYSKLKSKEEDKSVVYKKLEKISLDVDKKDQVLYIKSNYEKVIDKDVESSIEILLPEKLKNIMIDLKIGNINIENYLGRIKLNLDVGNIRASKIGLEGKNEVTLKMGNIDMDILNIDGDSLFIDLGIGNINLGLDKNLRCNIDTKGIIKEKQILKEPGMEFKIRSRLGKIDIEKS